jgi:hypothetical protein
MLLPILVCDAAVHPQTGETIPTIFRLSAFVPVNIPICAGMLLTSPTVNTVDVVFIHNRLSKIDLFFFYSYSILFSGNGSIKATMLALISQTVMLVVSKITRPF